MSYSPHVEARRQELITTEVKRILRAQSTTARADALISKERERSVAAQEAAANSMDTLREMFALSDEQISELIREARRIKRHLDDDEDDDE